MQLIYSSSIILQFLMSFPLIFHLSICCLVMANAFKCMPYSQNYKMKCLKRVKMPYMFLSSTMLAHGRYLIIPILLGNELSQSGS